MGEIRVTDDLLREILPKVSDELVKEWENSVTANHEFSKAFERKTKKFIWKHKNKQLLKELRVISKIAAAFILIFGLSFFGNTMVARANLDILFKKIEVALEDSYMYVYDEKTDTYSYSMYEPDYVPKGYEETLRTVYNNSIYIIYRNAEGKTISWNQIIVESGMVSGFDGEYDELIEKEYAGDNVKIYVYEDGYNKLYYEAGNSLFTIHANDISVKEIYKMIENMQQIEK